MTCLRDTNHKARKGYRCDSCLGAIVPGTHYNRLVGLSDGYFVCAHFHIDCRDWEVHLNKVNDLHGDDWCPLYEHVSEGGLDVLDGAPLPVKLRFPKYFEVRT